MEAEVKVNIFIEELIRQLRAVDQFGNWAKISDADLLVKKYVKTKEDLRDIPIIADIDEILIGDIRMMYQAIALAFERKTGVMCNVVMEMSHEGFGRCCILGDKIVLINKYFKDAHRFSFRTLEKLYEEGQRQLDSAFEIYEQFKPCVKGEE